MRPGTPTSHWGSQKVQKIGWGQGLDWRLMAAVAGPLENSPLLAAWTKSGHNSQFLTKKFWDQLVRGCQIQWCWSQSSPEAMGGWI